MITNVFPLADKQAWLQQAERELSDGQQPDSLNCTQPDGFVTRPYYTAEDIADLPTEAQQSTQRQTPGWLNVPAVALAEAGASNLTLRRIIAAGADALLLPIPPSAQLPRLLDGIKLSDTPMFFQETASATLTETTAFFTALRHVAPYQWRGGFIATEPEHIAVALTYASESPRFRAVGVDGRVFHNAGATAGQELALLLAQFTDHYDYLTDIGFSPDLLLSKTMAMVSVGTDYFTEIAKLRALRILFSYQLSVINYKGSVADSSFIHHHSLFIHCQTSTFYEAAATVHTNLLRGTAEAMSAVIGGCDALTVLPYNRLTNAPTELGDRLARNVSLLLRDESQLGRVADPSAGSYFVESLTAQLVETAWALFVQIEQMGGLAKATANGFVSDLLNKAYQAKVQAVEQGRVLVGVTKFRHDESTMPESALSLAVASDMALPHHRLSSEFED